MQTNQKIAFETQRTEEPQILPKIQPLWCDFEENIACSQREQTFTANQTLDWNYTFLWIQIRSFRRIGRYCFFSLSKNSQSNNMSTFWSCWNFFLWISEEFLIQSACLSVLYLFVDAVFLLKLLFIRIEAKLKLTQLHYPGYWETHILCVFKCV